MVYYLIETDNPYLLKSSRTILLIQPHSS